jgi:cephalosporin-C deacetylase
VTNFKHNYPFDPSYGYSLEDLLTIPAPAAPSDFVNFWKVRYKKALNHHPHPVLKATGVNHFEYDVYDLNYQSTDNITIGGWVLLPKHQPITQGIVVGHGYGGREGPDYHLTIPGAALLFPCFRGLSRSRCSALSEQPQYHVLHDIDKPNSYVIGGCVDDLWMAVSALLLLFPEVSGQVGYMGISFGGGIGALGIPWDRRIQRAHFNVPSFGQQPMRLKLPTCGSAAALQEYALHHGNVFETLHYYDAATAATYGLQPLHVAAALFDPVVAPPGQFAIYNAWAGTKTLFLLDAGHFEYSNQMSQEQALLQELKAFFG